MTIADSFTVSISTKITLSLFDSSELIQCSSENEVLWKKEG